jgi:hypothetical protein
MPSAATAARLATAIEPVIVDKRFSATSRRTDAEWRRCAGLARRTGVMRITLRTNPDAYMKNRMPQPKDFLRLSPGLARLSLRSATSRQAVSRRAPPSSETVSVVSVIPGSPTKQHGEDRQGEDQSHLESDDQHVEPRAIDTPMSLP